jgi:protein phosphatase
MIRLLKHWFAKKNPSAPARPSRLGATGEFPAAAPHGERFLAAIACLTDPGCVRELNEDSVLCETPADPALLDSRGSLIAVADGMGGAQAGEVASSQAVQTLLREYYRSANADTALALKEALAEANRAIYAAAAASDHMRGMGTTCAALALTPGLAYAAYVGDSRIYLVRGGEIYQLTEDHSMVGDLVRRGLLSRDEARNHEERNVILQALGTRPEIEPAIWPRPMKLREGDRFVISSDGLHDMVSDLEIRDIVLAQEPQQACAALVDIARSRGGSDNITLAVAGIRGASESSRPSPTRAAEVAS